MGRFSTTLNVKCADFASAFTELMKKRGFEPCKEDEAALSYLIAQSGGWATIAGESYNENPKQASEDADLFSKELNTSAFTVEVVDSDFAILKLNGDEVIVGDGSGYGIEDAPRGNKKLWEPLLENGTFEELTEIWGANEVFVEDALCKSAPLLGIDPNYICADFRDLSELSDDKNITALYFKKSDAKAKSMPLNAAFKKVFGEALEPLGFKLIKSKHPYFVKVVSDEIIHYVTIANERADGRGAHGVRYKCFNAYCGVSTVYSCDIDFNRNHAKFNSDFIDSISDVYTQAHWFDCDMNYRASIMRFYYDPTDNNSLISALKRALAAAEMHALPVIGQVVTLEKCIEYFRVMNHFIYPFLSGGGEGLLCTRLFSAEEYVMFCDKSREREIERCRWELDSDPNLSPKRKQSLETRIKIVMEGREEGKKKDYQFFTNPELQEKAPAELERRKAANTEILRSYGLDI